MGVEIATEQPARKSFLDNVVATKASEVKEKAALPEPTVQTDVDFENSVVRVTLEFPLDYDEGLAYKSKKSLVVGETTNRVPITFEKDGELYTLTKDGNAFSVTSRLVIYQEDKKQEETATADNDETGAQPPTE